MGMRVCGGMGYCVGLILHMVVVVYASLCVWCVSGIRVV